MKLAKMTNEQLDAALGAEIERAMIAGLETTEALDALFAERAARIEAVQRALMAEPVFTVKITRAQSDRLISQLPESLCGLTVTTTRATGTADDFADALECLCDEAALDYAIGCCMEDTTPAQDDFRRRSVLRSMKALRKALRRGALGLGS